MSEPIDTAHISKLGEEAADVARLCCVYLTGRRIGSIPDTRLNNAQLCKIADLYAITGLTIARLKLDVDQIQLIEQRKKKLHRAWFDMLAHALGAR